MSGLTERTAIQERPPRRSSFYWKLSSMFAGIALLGALFVGLLVRYQLGADLREELEQNLRRTCQVLAPYAHEQVLAGRVRSPDEELRRVGRETRIRLTWIRTDGLVLADTHADARLMENHASRKEVREALRDGFGREERASSTIGREMLYVAHVIESEGRAVGVIRAAMPLDEIHAQLSRVNRVVLVGAALGALGAALCGLFAARRITQPIAAMTLVAEAVREGDYEARARNLPRDELGSLGRALNKLSAELTDRLAESSLEKERLRAVLAGMVEGVVALDDREQILFTNQRACEFLAIDSRGQEDKRLWELVRVAGLSELIKLARELNGPAHAMLSVRRDGAELLLDAHATPFGMNSARGIALVLHDVTELRRLENVRRDFVANVSHELKTPLTAIGGFVETLLEGAIHDEKNNVRFLEKVNLHVGRLVHLVSDLLSLARIESDDGTRRQSVVDLGRVVDEVVRECGGEAETRGQRINVMRKASDVRVLGDRDGLFQVVGNLLENAIKYSPDGETIDIELGRDAESSWVEVRDRGIGIPSGERDRVFERFYRVDKARSRELGGTGLGLSIVKNLVGTMGGKLDLESQLGVGSRFRVEFPLPD